MAMTLLEVTERDRVEASGVMLEIVFYSQVLFSSTVENIFIYLMLPKTKSISIGIIYKPVIKPDFYKKSLQNLKNLFEKQLSTDTWKYSRKFCWTYRFEAADELSKTLADNILTNKYTRIHFAVRCNLYCRSHYDPLHEENFKSKICSLKLLSWCL